MDTLKDLLSGMADFTLFPLTEPEECTAPPTETEGIASYWRSVGGYIKEAINVQKPSSL